MSVGRHNTLSRSAEEEEEEEECLFKADAAGEGVFKANAVRRRRRRAG